MYGIGTCQLNYKWRNGWRKETVIDNGEYYSNNSMATTEFMIVTLHLYVML